MTAEIIRDFIITHTHRFRSQWACITPFRYADSTHSILYHEYRLISSPRDPQIIFIRRLDFDGTFIVQAEHWRCIALRISIPHLLVRMCRQVLKNQSLWQELLPQVSSAEGKFGTWKYFRCCECVCFLTIPVGSLSMMYVGVNIHFDIEA